MKIVMLGHKRIPSREGGIEIVVEELATRMAALGHEVTCLNRAGKHVSGKSFDTETLSAYKGVRIRKVLTLDKKGLAAVTSSISAAFCSAFSRADVVHIHAEGPAVMSWLPKLFGKKVVVTVHGLDWQREKWKGGFGAKYIHMGEKLAVRFADEIIVLSKNVQQYFEDTYGRKTVMIPNGVTKPEIRETREIAKKFGLHKDEYILFLGRLVPEKGIHYLIDAFRNVKTDKKLVIAGGSSEAGDYEQKLKKMAEDDENILFTGFVQGRMLEELYSNAYLYALPSDLEGMPLSLLEAMSYGNCCVTSDIEECAAVTEQYGLTFPKGNVDGLQALLQRLCDDAEKVKYYQEASAGYIMQKYSWDDVVNQTLELYQ